MAKYRQRPVIIEAFRFTGTVDKSVPDWFTEAEDNDIVRSNVMADRPYVRIATPNGAVLANVGDWIILSSEGEISTCNAAIFARSYELVEETHA